MRSIIRIGKQIGSTSRAPPIIMSLLVIEALLAARRNYSIAA
jgi:hypothetical protein